MPALTESDLGRIQQKLVLVQNQAAEASKLLALGAQFSMQAKDAPSVALLDPGVAQQAGQAIANGKAVHAGAAAPSPRDQYTHAAMTAIGQGMNLVTEVVAHALTLDQFVESLHGSPGGDADTGKGRLKITG